MSTSRQQAFIPVPAPTLWSLLGDPDRHVEWWPRVVEVHCEGLEQGCTYRQVTKSPSGLVETDISVERLEDCRALHIRCLDTGTYNRWLLVEAQGGTFVEVEFGMDPTSLQTRVFDVLAGRLYFRRWLEKSIDGLRAAAAEEEHAAA